MDHVLTGRARERPLEILSDTVPGPEGDGAGPGTGPGRGELGDEGVVRTDRLCQVTDEGLKKLLAGAVSGPLDDRTERGEFFNDSAGQVVGVVRGRSLLGRFCRSCARLGHRHLPDDEGPSQSDTPRMIESAHGFAGRSAGHHFTSLSARNRSRRATFPPFVRRQGSRSANAR